MPYSNASSTQKGVPIKFSNCEVQRLLEDNAN